MRSEWEPQGFVQHMLKISSDQNTHKHIFQAHIWAIVPRWTYERICVKVYLCACAHACVELMCVCSPCVAWASLCTVADVVVMGECSLDLHAHTRGWGRLVLKDQINEAFHTAGPPQTRQADRRKCVNVEVWEEGNVFHFAQQQGGWVCGETPAQLQGSGIIL